MAEKKSDKIDWDDPMVQILGMVPEYLLRPKLGLSEEYWRQWLRKNNVPAVTIKDVRWVSVDAWKLWFREKAAAGESAEH